MRHMIANDWKCSESGAVEYRTGTRLDDTLARRSYRAETTPIGFPLAPNLKRSRAS